MLTLTVVEIQHAAQWEAHMDVHVGLAMNPAYHSSFCEFPGDSFDTVYAPTTPATSYIQPA